MRNAVGTLFAPVETALARTSWLVAGITTLALFVLFFSAAENFNWLAISNVFTFSSILGIMVVGVGVLIISGEFDLSVGSAFAVVGFTFLALLNGDGATSNVFVAVVLSLGVGLLLGFFNGVVVVRSGNPSFIITLGTLLFYRGLARAIGDGAASSVSFADGDKPLLLTIFNTDITPINQSTRNLVVENPERGFIEGLFAWLAESGEGFAEFFVVGGNWQTSILWFFGIALVVGILLHRGKFGNWFYAVGGNRDGAQAQGVPPKLVKLGAFMLVGFLVALAAIIDMSQRQSISPRTGTLFELFVVAGLVMGGYRLRGGFGAMLGGCFGIIMIALLREGLPQLGFSVEFYQAAFGTMLILVAALNQFLGRANE